MLPDAKRGFVLLPRRGVVERSFAWAARFRRLAKDYERLPEVFAGRHFLAFLTLMLRRLLVVAGHSPQQALRRKSWVEWNDLWGFTPQETQPAARRDGCVFCSDPPHAFASTTPHRPVTSSVV